jgi:uncharacterized protein involved in exopolysaccharide biosynthesis
VDEQQIAERHAPAATVRTIDQYPGVLQHDTVNIVDMLSVCYQRRWLVMKIAALVLVLGMLITLLQRPQYTATAKLLVTSANANLDADAMPMITMLQAATQRHSVLTQVEVISSDDLLHEAFQQLPAAVRARGFGADELPSWAVRVGNVKDTDVIHITAKAYTSSAASSLANAVADLYFQRDLEQSQQAIGKVRKDVEKSMNEIKEQLDQADIALSRLKRTSGLLDVSTQFTKMAEYQANLQVEVGNARAVIASMKSAQRVLQQQLADEQHMVVNNTLVTDNPQFNAITARIDALNAERAALLQEYHPDSAEVKAMTGRIAEEEARLHAIAKTITAQTQHARNPIRDELLSMYSTNLSQIAAQEARTRALDAELQNSRSSALSLPAKERQLTEHIRQVAFLQGTYDMLRQRYYALLASEKATLPAGRLISRATPADTPANPSPLQNAGLFLALGLLIGGVVSVRSGRFDSMRAQLMPEDALPLAADDRLPNDEPALSDEPLPALLTAHEPIDNQHDEETPIHTTIEDMTAQETTTPAEAPPEARSPAVDPPRRPARSARWTLARKREVVLAVMSGRPLEDVAQENHLPVIRLALWHDCAWQEMDATLAESVVTDHRTTGGWGLDERRNVAIRLLTGESVDDLARELGIDLLSLAICKEQARIGLERSLKEHRHTDLLAAEYQKTRRHLHDQAAEPHAHLPQRRCA